MFSNNLKLAVQSLSSAKWRTFLTMVGVIIGVFSVTVAVSIGVGIRQQITSQIKTLGPDLITILPGQSPTISPTNILKRVNVLPTVGVGAFSQKDLTLIGATKGVRLAVPLTSISGSVTVNGTKYEGQQIIATTQGFPGVVNQSVNFGQFFNSDDPYYNNEAVIGQGIAYSLFKETNPLGEQFIINGQQFRVTGILSPFTTSPLTPVSDYDNAIFIPFSVGAQMSGNQAQIYEIFAKPNSVSQTDQVAKNINATLARQYGSQDNYSVLEQKQILKIANSTLNVLTALIAAIAGISLFVGGVGIMNIMLVSVIERTKEIGIRKAIGATNKQILSQFLIEAGIIGFIGGIIGVFCAIVAGVLISYFTSLRPAFNWQIIVIAIAGALLAGLIFGTMPALRASRRDPIDSLRHE